jgi:hypothetical protein
VPVIQVLRKLKQVDFKFETRLSFVVREERHSAQRENCEVDREKMAISQA